MERYIHKYKKAKHSPIVPSFLSLFFLVIYALFASPFARAQIANDVSMTFMQQAGLNACLEAHVAIGNPMIDTASRQPERPHLSRVFIRKSDRADVYIYVVSMRISSAMDSAHASCVIDAARGVVLEAIYQLSTDAEPRVVALNRYNPFFVRELENQSLEEQSAERQQVQQRLENFRLMQPAEEFSFDARAVQQ